MGNNTPYLSGCYVYGERWLDDVMKENKIMGESINCGSNWRFSKGIVSNVYIRASSDH